jgi:hypothetical protein
MLKGYTTDSIYDYLQLDKIGWIMMPHTIIQPTWLITHHSENHSEFKAKFG